jgi:hypothetical protein
MFGVFVLLVVFVPVYSLRLIRCSHGRYKNTQYTNKIIYMDNIGPIGAIILYAPLAIAITLGSLLVVYAVKRKRYWVGFIGIAVILIFLSLYFYP